MPAQPDLGACDLIKTNNGPHPHPSVVGYQRGAATPVGLLLTNLFSLSFKKDLGLRS